MYKSETGRREATKYWDFDPRHTISYPRDWDYEEHFGSLLKTSVLRRLRSDAPILAELSGGVDSSSIVCVADTLVGEWPGTSKQNRHCVVLPGWRASVGRATLHSCDRKNTGPCRLPH